MGATPLPRIAVNGSSPILWTRSDVAALERDMKLRRSRRRSRRRRAHHACLRLIEHRLWVLTLPEGPPESGGRPPPRDPGKPANPSRRLS